MYSIQVVLLVLSLVFLVINAVGKLPLWPSVLMLLVIELLEKYPK